MPVELAVGALRDSRRGIAAWCVGVAAYVAMVAAIYPSVETSPEFNELVERYPEVLKSLFGIVEGGDITSGPGFVDVELFSFMLPLLLLVLAIGYGARTLAGEEDAGRLELLLAYPLRRRASVVAKGAALAAQIAVVSVAGWATLLVIDPLVGLALDFGNLCAAFVGVAVLALFHGWLALGVGAAVPSRALAIAVPAGAAALGYLVNGLHDLAGWLAPFRFVSPFWLVGSSPLQTGIDAAGTLVVLAAAVVVLAGGALLLERRDLQTP